MKRRFPNNGLPRSTLAVQSNGPIIKTGDNVHPAGNEQQLMRLMNSARANPTQEGIWLATMTDPDACDHANKRAPKKKGAFFPCKQLQAGASNAKTSKLVGNENF